MNSFDFSLYDTEDETPLSIPKKEPVEPKKAAFDFDQYDVPMTPKEREKEVQKEVAVYDKMHQKIAAPEKTAEEIQNMTWQERNQYALDLEREQRYTRSRGATKGFLSELTLGYTDKYPELKPIGETGELAGRIYGQAAPLTAVGGLLGLGFRALGTFLNVGSKGAAALGITSAFSTGAALETGKEAIKGEGFSPEEIAIKGAEFATIDALFRGAPVAYNWLKSLKTKDQAKMLVQGVLPEGLPPDQYKFFEQEVVPELQKAAQQEYQEAAARAVEENNAVYQQELANARAAHERDLYELTQKKQMSSEEYQASKQQYENKLKQIAAEHEAKSLEIQKQNEQAVKEYEAQNKAYEEMKSREALVKQAIRPKDGGVDLQGRVTSGGEDVGYRPAPSVVANPSIENRVGNVISPNRITNTSSAGRSNIEAVRANDAIDYNNVREAYARSEQLNQDVEVIQPNLVNSLRSRRDELLRIPDPSPPQKELLNIINKILDATQITNEAGQLIGFKPINNRVLQEQAKSMRYFMDFNFEHGNSRGIFSPTVGAIEDAIEMGASFVGNQDAIAANQQARHLYSRWADMYDNPYIRPYRDTSNRDFSRTFEKSLHIDEFGPLNDVLSQSNAGQQLSGSTRRALVDRYLAPFYKNPTKIDKKAFNDTLSELRAVISPQEEQAIRQQFNQELKTPYIPAKKIAPIEVPKEPKLKEQPSKERIPTFKAKEKVVEEPTSVKIPLKKEVKPTREMTEAAKRMEVTPEEVMKQTNTVSGLKALKKDLTKTTPGKQLYERITKHKVKEILYEGNVQRQFKGDELYRTINKGDNYSMLSELLGEEATEELLQSSKQIADKKVTVDNIRKYGGSLSLIKILKLYGFF